MFISNKAGDDEKYEAFKMASIISASRPSLELPPLGIHPANFIATHFGSSSNNRMQFNKGTTTLGIIYEPAVEGELGGVVIAVDSRASAGDYIASQTCMKLLHISDKMVGTMAGGAADCQFWNLVVRKYCKLFELREKQEISVRAASKYMANVLYGYRGQDLMVYSMVAGVDKLGPAIFYVNSEGQRFQQREVFSCGSGSLNAYGFLDTHYKRKMTAEEAINLGRQAIMHATFRDGASGGRCTIAHITAKGKTMYGPFDVSDLFYDFSAKMGITTAPDEVLNDD